MENLRLLFGLKFREDKKLGKIIRSSGKNEIFRNGHTDVSKRLNISLFDSRLKENYCVREYRGYL